MGDINGDGLADIVGFGNAGVYVGYSTGTGFTATTNKLNSFGNTAASGSWGSNSKHPRYILDVNSDGFGDILGFAENGTHVALSYGNGFHPIQKWTSSFGRTGWGDVKDIRTFGDFNGDGLLDIAGFIKNGVEIGENKSEPQRINQIIVGGYLPAEGETQYNGLNRSIEIVYDKLTSTTYPDLYNPYKSPLPLTGYIGKGLTPALFVVSQHYSSNGDVSNNRKRQAGMSYTYKGFDVDRKTYRGSLGFSERSVRDEITGITTTSQYDQTYPFIGSTRSTVTKTADKKVLSETLNLSYFLVSTCTSEPRYSIGSDFSSIVRCTENTQSSAPTSSFYSTSINSLVGRNEHRYIQSIYSLASTETNYAYTDKNTAYKRINTVNSEQDSCGNIGNITTTITNLLNNNTHTKATVNSYPESGDCFAKSRLSRATVTSTSNVAESVAEPRTSSFTYYPWGQIKTEIIEPNNNDLKLTTTYEYDAFGNISKRTLTGADTNRETRYDYKLSEAKGRYPVITTIKVGGVLQSTTRTYDPKFGTVTSVKDPNDLTSSTQYNVFGQKYLQTSTTGEKTHISYTWCNEPISIDSEGNSNLAHYCTTTESESGGYSKTYYDQIDRVLRTVTKGLGADGEGETLVYNDKKYNLRTGQLEAESLPYYSGATQQWITYEYDGLERPKSITQPGQLADTISYDGLTTIKTDQTRKGGVVVKLSTTETKTAEGKPALVTDAMGNTISYAYFADGNLHKTTVTASDTGTSATTSFTYDAIGNKATMSDPDMGDWAYTYYPTGELKTQTNANGKTTSMTYDNLGRIKTRTDEGAGTTTWIYDSLSGQSVGKSTGKIVSITAPGGYKKTLQYNGAQGQVSSMTEHLPNSVDGGVGKTYTTQTSYDTFGRVSTITYPQADSFNPVIVKHHYTRNALTQISNLSETKSYWTAKEARADGQLTSELLGNGVKTIKGYDDLGRISSIQSGITNKQTMLQQLSYSFDGAGNLRLRHDLNGKLKEDFTYDNLYRLDTITTAYSPTTGGGAYTDEKRHKYDGHGNIIEKNDGQSTKVYTYGTGSNDLCNEGDKGGIHAVSSIGGNNYCYDNNGNLLSGVSRSYTWTTFDKPSRIIGAQDTLNFAYDAGRNRIIKDSNKETTWYVGGLYERTQKKSDNTELHKYYLKAGGKTIAYITHYQNSDKHFVAENTRYLLHDHLGSTDKVLNDTGTTKETLLKQDMSFSAWGKHRGSSGVLLGSIQLRTIMAGIELAAQKLPGFTGHEHDGEVGLINMKGRLYDADLGRFISADPIVQAPRDTQSYNRYTYVKNNPLSLVDPSGYSWLSKLWKKVKRFVKKWGRTILAIAATIYTAGAAAAWLGANTALGAFGVAVGAGAAGGFAGGLISTGSLKGALTGAVFGALSAGLASGVKAAIPIDGIGRTVAHGVAQGTVTVLRGGKFSSGFAGGFFGHMTGGFVKGIGKAKSWGIYARTAVASVVGGTIAKISGGKFANGAVSAAFTHLFNSESRSGGSTSVREGRKGNPISGGWKRVKFTWFEKARSFIYTQLFKGLTGIGIAKVHPTSLRLVPNPVSAGLLGLTPNSTGGCNSNGMCSSDIPPFRGPHLPFNPSPPEP